MFRTGTVTSMEYSLGRKICSSAVGSKRAPDIPSPALANPPPNAVPNPTLRSRFGNQSSGGAEPASGGVAAWLSRSGSTVPARRTPRTSLLGIRIVDPLGLRSSKPSGLAEIRWPSSRAPSTSRSTTSWPCMPRMEGGRGLDGAAAGVAGGGLAGAGAVGVAAGGLAGGAAGSSARAVFGATRAVNRPRTSAAPVEGLLREWLREARRFDFVEECPSWRVIMDGGNSTPRASPSAGACPGRSGAGSAGRCGFFPGIRAAVRAGAHPHGGARARPASLYKAPLVLHDAPPSCSRSLRALQLRMALLRVLTDPFLQLIERAR